MDPQKLLTLDKRIVATIRISGLTVSLMIALVCVLVYQRIIVLPVAYYSWACLPLAGAITLIGLALALWEPYTLRKVTLYTWAYIAIGGLLSVLVLGFSSFIFLAWLLLIATVGVYLRAWGAWVTYFAMVISLGVWIVLRTDLNNSGELFNLIGSAAVVGVLVYVSLNVLRLTNKVVTNLDDSHAKVDFEHGQLTSLINSMADGVIAVDETAKVLLYNAAALNILDLNSSMQGASIGLYLKPITKEGAAVDIVNFVQNTHTATINRDLRIRYKDGSYVNLYLSVAPVHLGFGKGSTPGFVLLLRDITREKSLEEERDEFISVVSHELRTPIAIAEGNISNAQIIVDKAADPQAIKKALEDAHSQVLFLADMINDLATLSRAERGKLTLELEPLHIKDFMAELVKNYTLDAEKKGLKLLSTVADNVTDLNSSKLYVREVLQNFITNAIKYTEAGSVTIAAENKDNGLLFKISDTGIGISKADQERVFDKFFRSEDFRTRQHNGTGLGLYVTMKLAKMIHADINLESELNKGSVFSIFIPNLEDKMSAATKEKTETSTVPQTGV